MREDLEKYEDLENRAFGYAEGMDDESEFEPDMEYYEDYDNSLSDIDFSELRGDSFKKSFSKVNRKINTNTKISKVIAPDNREVIVEGKERPMNFKASSTRVRRQASAKRPASRVPSPVASQSAPRRKAVSKKPAYLTKDIPIKARARHTLKGSSSKKVSKVIIPDDKKVIVQGVSDFILSQSKDDIAVKNIGYYKGKKLKELVLTFNNNSALPFVLELFNPSMPLDYLYSTSLNLNDKITVAGGEVSYTDVLHNMLANTIMVPNCKFVFAGPSVTEQKSIALKVNNKSVEGKVKVHPLNLNLQVDSMQVAKDIVFFDIMDMLNRPFIPDGMDIIDYTVLPGMTVTMCFFYEQVSLKKVFYKEAKQTKGLM